MNTGLDAVGPDPQPDGQDPRPGEDPGQQEGGAQEDRGPPADRDDQQVAREHMHKLDGRQVLQISTSLAFGDLKSIWVGTLTSRRVETE